MTAKVKYTETQIRRAIKAAQKEGLPIQAVLPDGTVLIGERIALVPELKERIEAATGKSGKAWWEELE